MAGDTYHDNLGYLCRAAARTRPAHPAIVDLADGSERIATYAALDEGMDRVAAALMTAGLRPGDTILLAASNRIAFVEAMFGAMRAGVVPVPVNTRLGADTLAYIAQNAEVKGAIVEAAACPQLVAVVEAAGLPHRYALDKPIAGWPALTDAMATAPLPFAPPALAPDHLAFLPYTSGSTGRPKGVPLSHAGQLWWVRTALNHWPPADDTVSLVAVPLYHKNAMAGAVKPRLAHGGTIVMLPGFEARAFLATIPRYRVTNISAVPTVYTLLLQHKDLIGALDLSSLRVAVVGSAPVHEELEADMQATLGVTVLQSYGLTEGGPVMLGPPPDGRPVPRGSAGAAWPEGDVKIVAADGREILGAGEGELWVRNPGVPAGYFKQDAVNRERFVDGFLRTGDLFARDADGFYYFKGRTDDMFKSAGESIYPKEVENLLKRHPDVVDACVVPVPHVLKGMVPVALVVPRAGAAVDEDALRRFTLANGPAYAHPRRIVFTDALPHTGVGKVDRSGIRAALEAEIGTLGDA